MRKVDDGEKKKKKKKITAVIVATNVVASRPPNGDRLQRRRSCQLLSPVLLGVQFRYFCSAADLIITGGQIETKDRAEV